MAGRRHAAVGLVLLAVRCERPGPLDQQVHLGVLEAAGRVGGDQQGRLRPRPGPGVAARRRASRRSTASRRPAA